MFVVHVEIYYVGNPEGWKGEAGIHKKPLLSINKVRFPKIDTFESCKLLIEEDYKMRVKRGRSCTVNWSPSKAMINYVTITGGIYKGTLSIKKLEDMSYVKSKN